MCAEIVIDWKGGDKLEAVLEKLQKQAEEAGVLKVGFFADAQYGDGTQVAQIAADNEFGATVMHPDGKPITIPPRPFFRNAIADNSPEWGKQLAGLIVATDYNIGDALDGMGERIKGQIVQSIDDTTDPPNSPRTLAIKHGSHPLIDTNVMRTGVGYEVVTGEK